MWGEAWVYSSALSKIYSVWDRLLGENTYWTLTWKHTPDDMLHNGAHTVQWRFTALSDKDPWFAGCWWWRVHWERISEIRQWRRLDPARGIESFALLSNGAICCIIATSSWIQHDWLPGISLSNSQSRWISRHCLSPIVFADHQICGALVQLQGSARRDVLCCVFQQGASQYHGFKIENQRLRFNQHLTRAYGYVLLSAEGWI